MERGQSIVRDPKFQVQQSKVGDGVGLGRTELQMVKPLRSYNPCDEVVSEVSHRSYPFTMLHTSLVAHLNGKEYVRCPQRCREIQPSKTSQSFVASTMIMVTTL